MDDALAEFVPLSLRGIDLHKSTNVAWKDVGGLDKAKKMLEEILIWPSKVSANGVERRAIAKALKSIDFYSFRKFSSNVR